MGKKPKVEEIEWKVFPHNRIEFRMPDELIGRFVAHAGRYRVINTAKAVGKKSPRKVVCFTRSSMTGAQLELLGEFLANGYYNRRDSLTEDQIASAMVQHSAWR